MVSWFDEYVLQTYSQIARHFDKTRHGLWPEIRWYTSLLSEKARVLDVGTGNGRNAFYLASFNHDVIGLDVVPEMVEVASDNAKDKGVKNISFIEGDARSLPFKDNELDGVVCIAALHHLPSENDRMKVMSECWRVLKEGGIALISVWAREQARFATTKPVAEGAPEGDVLIPWTRDLDNKVFERYYHLFTLAEFEDMVERSPWEGVVFSHAHNHHVFGRKGGGAKIEEVPTELRQSIEG